MFENQILQMAKFLYAKLGYSAYISLLNPCNSHAYIWALHHSDVGVGIADA